MTDGDAIVLAILGLALVATPISIGWLWLDMRRRLRRIAQIIEDPRRQF